MNDLETLAYSDGEIGLTSHVARPKGVPRAAVLVFPTIMNPGGFVFDKAKSLADHGYLALVADFYGKQPENFDQSREFAMEIRQTPDSYRNRLRAGLKALAGMEEARGLPIGAIGFCMGGQATLELARDGAPLFAAVSFHGLLNTEQPAEPGRISARILVCHGDADPMVPRQQVIKFWEEMDHAGGNWHFHSYAGVKHGFCNPQPNSNPATAYDESADRQSWASMFSLFDEVLA
ncbi:dienelactone hydrolase [Altererythrobacter atlanticus]|uniref:Dienelactone hydrolase family protein n=1 Tax=Croceibacterium atlanticum TaxID=1267766 RepID=A0A0F7KS22_9SPHN|nr:dienelactone hydrolase family protein [Croceibacterium atlanticum]AKH41555.1 Dienelactone hydrolase family protein [Croceibacterium atlanticum]MBB5733017.1 dienelactone hydrolase [Croceibacterium atlanticum]